MFSLFLGISFKGKSSGARLYFRNIPKASGRHQEKNRKQNSKKQAK